MKEVYRHPDPSRVAFYRSLVEEAGIACTVLNEFSGAGVFGGLELFHPALCVLNDSDHHAAWSMINAHENQEAAVLAPWDCPSCGENVSTGFATCWNCGRDLPLASAET